MISENTKTKDQKSKTKNQIVWLSFIFLIVFTYFFGLSMPLVGPDEPRYAQVAREMFERGDWITPTLGGFDWFEKPAMLYWLEIASYKIFGVNEFAARFGSAIFGLGTIFCLWILGKFSATENTEENEKSKTNNISSENSVFSVAENKFANWLALIAATSIGLIVFSRGASFDIILTFPITASMVSFFLYDRAEKKSGFAFYFLLFTFYFFIGISLIAKGLVGIVFPMAIVAFYHLLSWKLPSKTLLLSLIWGIILSAAVASAWYLPMYQTNGWKFVDEFFVQHHFQRFTSDKYQHYQPFWFFFLVLPLMTIPWLPFFLIAIFDYFKSQIAHFKSKKSQIPNSKSQIQSFAFAWLAVPLVFFSLSGSKLPGYILPALPAAIVLTAICAFDFVQKSKMRGRILQGLAAAVLIFVLVALQFFAADYARHETVKNIVETADAKGFADAKFVSLYTVSHSLEFYAANRLIREENGKLKRFDNFYELIQQIKSKPEEKILVVVPLANVANLQKENQAAETELIAENGESAIVFVKPK